MRGTADEASAPKTRWTGAAALSLALLFAAALGACSEGLSTAKADFRKGRIAEAKTELERLAPETRSWSSERRAEYALYRGLVYHSLGDRIAARFWLAEAKAIEDAEPHTLSEEDHVRLKLALESLAPDSAPPSP